MASQLPTIELRGSDDGVVYGTVIRARGGKLTATGAGVPLLRQAEKYGEASADTWGRLKKYCSGPLRAVVVAE